MTQSSPFTLRRLFILLGRLFLGGLFVYAGYAKLYLPGMNPHPPISVALALFATQIDSYQLLPPSAVNLLAHTLPFVEIALGILLILGMAVRIWATIASVILLGFFAVVVRSYAMGLQINCGCFGPGEALTVKTVIRDGLYVAVSLLVTIFAFFESHASHPWSAPEKA